MDGIKNKAWYKMKRIRYSLSRLLFPLSGIPGWSGAKDLRFLYSLVLRVRAENCIEIGTFLGRSSHAICLALKKMGGQRRLLCVDVFDYPVSEHWEDEGVKMIGGYPEILRPYLEPGRKICTLMDGFKFTLERHPFMKDFVEIRSCDSRNLELGQEMFDFAFIDGDHSYEGAKNDFFKIRPRMRKSGIICFHDNYDVFPGVQKFVSEVRKMNDLAFFAKSGLVIAFKCV